MHLLTSTDKQNMSVNIDDILSRIFSILDERKTTKKHFCECCRINYQSLHDWKIRRTIPSAEVLLRISEYLGVTMEYLLTGRNILTDDVAAACSLLMGIDQEHRKAVLAMIRSQYDFYRRE